MQMNSDALNVSILKSYSRANHLTYKSIARDLLVIIGVVENVFVGFEERFGFAQAINARIFIFDLNSIAPFRSSPVKS